MDPYALYNGLDQHHRDKEGVHRPPPYPSRVRHFIYACAQTAAQQEGGGAQRRR